jgi:hypothetical protein
MRSLWSAILTSCHIQSATIRAGYWGELPGRKLAEAAMDAIKLFSTNLWMMHKYVSGSNVEARPNGSVSVGE